MNSPGCNPGFPKWKFINPERVEYLLWLSRRWTLKKVDVGVAYAIWSGLGTALIATIGIIHFREPITLLKIVGLVAIIGGVVMLNLSGRTH